MVIDGESVALYADGEEAIRTAVSNKLAMAVVSGKLTVSKATLATYGTLDFNGSIDDLRLSNLVREVRKIPSEPLQADGHTIGLWNFDAIEDAKRFLDMSATRNPLQVSSAKSLDEIDRIGYKASPPPLDSRAEMVSLKVVGGTSTVVTSTRYLDGYWKLATGVCVHNGRGGVLALTPSMGWISWHKSAAM